LGRFPKLKEKERHGSTKKKTSWESGTHTELKTKFSEEEKE
jgi:hypothetical protein